MKLRVNGEPKDVRSSTLSELVIELGYRGDQMATAVNHEVVLRSDRADLRLNEGDEVELLAPMGGG